MTETNRIENDPSAIENWLLMPGGRTAILRYASPVILPDTRLATHSEMVAMNLGKRFPYGDMPSSAKASPYWKHYKMGLGGLFHHEWFITEENDGTRNRVGGADNVPEELPGSMRRDMYVGGGMGPDDYPAGNEGYALIKHVDPANRDYYRQLQLRVARHVAADGGSVITTPLSNGNEAQVGFIGRCLFCENAKDISVLQLQQDLPQFKLSLLPEWRNGVPILSPNIV